MVKKLSGHVFLARVSSACLALFGVLAQHRVVPLLLRKGAAYGLSGFFAKNASSFSSPARSVASSFPALRKACSVVSA